MSHVDEGTIHAWLDGAFGADDPERARIEEHLADCESCRSRIDAERRVRDRAAAVLGVAAPDAVRVEPFERILAARRARDAATAASGGPGGGDSEAVGGPGSVKGPARFRVPMALAATLVLAVGATWFMRQYLPLSAPTADSALEAASGEDAASLPSTVAVPPPMVASQAEAEQAITTEAQLRPGEPPAPATLARGTREEPQRSADLQAAAGSTVAGAAVARPPTAADERGRSPAETRRLAESALANVVGRAAAAPVTFADADAMTAVDRLDARYEVSWVVADIDTVATRFGMVPVSLAGYSPDSVQLATIGGAPVARLVYRIDGQPIELVQWVTGTVSAAEQAFRQRDEAVEQARIDPGVAAKGVAPTAPSVYRIGGIDFVIRGPLSPDSLAALAAAGVTGGG